MLKGKKVIVKGNEEPYFVGRLIGVDTMPVVLKYIDRKEYCVFGVIVLYNEELAQILDDMDVYEQWDYLRPFNLSDLIVEENNG